MNIKDFKEYLTHIKDDELEVVVHVNKKGILGASPTVGVDFIMRGIDWNIGQLIIYPEVDLQEVPQSEAGR